MRDRKQVSGDRFGQPGLEFARSPGLATTTFMCVSVSQQQRVVHGMTPMVVCGNATEAEKRELRKVYATNIFGEREHVACPALNLSPPSVVTLPTVALPTP